MTFPFKQIKKELKFRNIFNRRTMNWSLIKLFNNYCQLIPMGTVLIILEDPLMCTIHVAIATYMSLYRQV